MSATIAKIERFDGQYRFLSNFWPAIVKYEGITYPSVEHAYQAAKTFDRSARASVAALDTAGQAKRAGRGLVMRPDWDLVKLDVMRELLVQKFSEQTPRQLLLATAPAELIEGNSWGDHFWGVCGGEGENYLGKLLMSIRDSLCDASPPYQRPTISASRLKSIGGEKGAPGCERKTAGSYLFDMKQSSSPALEFGSALHSMAEHFQATGELLDPESDVGRVLAAGAHMLQFHEMLVEYEHVGTLPDGSPYVAYLDGHTNGDSTTNTVIIQDLKTTSNPRYALTGPDDEDADGTPGDYDLRKDLQAMFYAWILLCDAHWYCPPLTDGALGPKHWRWWDPTAKGLKSGCLRWVYFLTRGVARAWEANAFTTPSGAAAHMAEVILPLVARINALHEWHYAHPHATLDEIDRTPAACNNRGRWCGVGERDACNFDKLGTPALDLVQLKVRKMTTPQERLALLQQQNAAKRAAAGGAPATAPVAEAPAASPPATPVPASPAPAETALVSEAVTPAAPSTPDAPAVPANDTSAVVAAAAELTRGQKAAATRAANKKAPVAPPPGPGINPPEGAEGVPTTAPVAAPSAAARLADQQRIGALSNQDGGATAPTVCPAADELLALLSALVGKVPVGVTITIEGQR